MATLVHFDISADDTGRAQRFYQQLLGWTFTSLPAPMEYTMIATTDVNGAPGVGGGMAKRTGQGPGIVNFFGVASVDQSLKQVEQLGGKVVQPKQPVPGFGYMAVCQDTESNVFGLFQDDPTAR
jgi:predicted enzyme related to lactoylglutathione lyase